MEVGISSLEGFTLLSSSSTTLPNKPTCVPKLLQASALGVALFWAQRSPGLHTAGSGGAVAISTLARISQAVGDVSPGRPSLW